MAMFFKLSLYSFLCFIKSIPHVWRVSRNPMFFEKKKVDACSFQHSAIPNYGTSCDVVVKNYSCSECDHPLFNEIRLEVFRTYRA